MAWSYRLFWMSSLAAFIMFSTVACNPNKKETSKSTVRPTTVTPTGLPVGNNGSGGTNGSTGLSFNNSSAYKSTGGDDDYGGYALHQITLSFAGRQYQVNSYAWFNPGYGWGDVTTTAGDQYRVSWTAKCVGNNCENYYLLVYFVPNSNSGQIVVGGILHRTSGGITQQAFSYQYGVQEPIDIDQFAYSIQ